MPELSIIIPTHSRREVLRALLDRLLANDEIDHEIIVLDDASTDGTAEMLRDYPSVTAIRNETSQGFDALPKAIAKARGEWLFFLDDDAYPAEGTLAAVLEHARERGPKLGVVALPFQRPGTDRLSYTPYFPKMTPDMTYAPARAYHAGAVVVRREAAEQVPPSPPGYFMYETEAPATIEYLAHGWEADYLPGAPVFHIWDSRGPKVKERAAFLPLRNDFVTIDRYFRGWRRAEMLAGRYLTGFFHLAAAGSPFAVVRARREARALLATLGTRDVSPDILARVYPCFDGLTLMTFFSETNRRRVAWFFGRLPIDQTC